LEAKIKENAWYIEKMIQKNKEIDDKYRTIKKEQERTKRYLRELCSIDPITYALLKKGVAGGV